MKWELAEKQVWVDSDGMELEVCLVRDDHLCYHEPGLGLVACSSEYILGRAHLIKHQSGADIDEEKYEYRMGSFGQWEGDFWQDTGWVKSCVEIENLFERTLYRRLKQSKFTVPPTEPEVMVIIYRGKTYEIHPCEVVFGQGSFPTQFSMSVEGFYL